MHDFAGKIAVVTGGATGMGRELVRQLAGAGCHVATCDVSVSDLDETLELARVEAPGVTLTAHGCDVSDETAVGAFRDQVVADHDTDHVHLLFNNAGIGGGGSLVTAPRETWDRVFAVNWGGVYHVTTAFLPLLIAAPAAHLVNTSSVNGFWASLGPDQPNTAYSAAKFAVKGFTEALITDFRVNAPHVRASVVMPGHIGTSIVANSFRHGGGEEARVRTAAEAEMVDRMFRETAPMTAAEAATVILDAVRADEWRILVGADAKRLDEWVRADPTQAYDPPGPPWRE